jgi:lipopolysaccharide transport system ATP-binding protein
MKPIIEVRQLSKKYRICHESQGAYSTIVDSLTKYAKRFKDKCLGKELKDTRSYEDFWALKDVSFTCNPGDRIGIMGKNGSGKSTLLKILSRITYPTEGAVRIRGRVASLLEVGTGFHPELTGRENIFLNGAILGMRKQEIQKKFDEIVAFSEVERFLDTPVKFYSSGMYTRLGFAIAAHLEPDILIVDEVLAVGDAQFQEKCLNKMDSVSRSGKTILFVSHNPQATLSLCNKGLYLENGSLKMAGEIESCVHEYLKSARRSAFSWNGNLGDQSFRLLSASVKKEREFFYQNETVHLKMRCEVKEESPSGILGIEIKNGRGIVVAPSLFPFLQTFYGKGNTLSIRSTSTRPCKKSFTKKSL